MYSDIVNSIEIGSQRYFRSHIKKNRFSVIPGWNTRVKDHYNVARQAYKRWLGRG